MHTATINHLFFLFNIDYCDSVWNCCGRTNADNTEKLRRREARSCKPTLSSDDALAHLKHDTLGLRWEILVLNLVKKCLNKHCPQFLWPIFVSIETFYILQRTGRDKAIISVCPPLN